MSGYEGDGKTCSGNTYRNDSIKPPFCQKRFCGWELIRREGLLDLEVGGRGLFEGGLNRIITV